jgi:hypothetical protein
MPTLNKTLLEAALEGLEARRSNLDAQITSLRSLLRDGESSRIIRRGRHITGAEAPASHDVVSPTAGRQAARASANAPKSGGGTWTPERRRRMAESMKRRWADGSIQRALKRAKR